MSRGEYELRGPRVDGLDEVLTSDALAFLEVLLQRFEGRRHELLALRRVRQMELDQGVLPDFLSATRAIRQAEWSVAPIPDDLQDRRVEITGPVDRKMIINALNSHASVFMADFEDATSPTWQNVVEGQRNLQDAVRRTISYRSPEGKSYRLDDHLATLMVRPRGWHLPEKHLVYRGRPVSAALFDFGLFLFHNARELIDRGSGPYFYLPKLESHLEARLWNDVFLEAQDSLGLPRGTIRATVLIETILAAFEMDEILYELREHSAGLNCGRWDYIFSTIKKFRQREEFIFPDREQITMTTHGLRSYSLLAIQTCHRRGTHAIGGMAAQIPVKNDPEANREALAKVRADKDREAGDGHDGTWVAHPGLVELARASFDARLRGPNQIDRKREDVHVTAKDLLTVPKGPITERGLRHNLDVAIRYLGSWLGGTGCVPIYNLMEDAATSEISRAQVWQWIRHDRGVLEDGRAITSGLCRSWIAEELAGIQQAAASHDPAIGHYGEAAGIIEQIVTKSEFTEFLTSAGYDLLA